MDTSLLSNLVSAFEKKGIFTQIGKNYPKQGFYRSVYTFSQANKLITTLPSGFMWDLAFKNTKDDDVTKDDELLPIDKVYSEWSRRVAIKLKIWDNIHSDIEIHKARGIFIENFGFFAGALYSRATAPVLYWREIIGLYLEGRYPCGWDGNFPDGTLIIF